MRKISLFIAMSLDGYIADSKGSVEWLTGQSNDDSIDAYSEFVKDIDTVIMGWNTYHQIITKLSPDKWVYDDFTTYVVTHHKEISSDGGNNFELYFEEDDFDKFADKLKECDIEYVHPIMEHSWGQSSDLQCFYRIGKS